MVFLVFFFVPKPKFKKKKKSGRQQKVEFEVVVDVVVCKKNEEVMHPLLPSPLNCQHIQNNKENKIQIKRTMIFPRRRKKRKAVVVGAANGIGKKLCSHTIVKDHESIDALLVMTHREYYDHYPIFHRNS